MTKLEEEVRNWNLWYLFVYHKFCHVKEKWVFREELKCILCDPDNPKCFVLGGDHDDS